MILAGEGVSNIGVALANLYPQFVSNHSIYAIFLPKKPIVVAQPAYSHNVGVAPQNQQLFPSNSVNSVPAASPVQTISNQQLHSVSSNKPGNRKAPPPVFHIQSQVKPTFIQQQQQISTNYGNPPPITPQPFMQNAMSQQQANTSPMMSPQHPPIVQKPRGPALDEHVVDMLNQTVIGLAPCSQNAVRLN